MELIEEKTCKSKEKGCYRHGRAATISNLIIEDFAEPHTPTQKNKN